MMLLFNPKNYREVTFLDFIPRRMEDAVRGKENKEQDDKVSIAFHLDQIDFFFRQYISGHSKTLHRLFWELARPISQMKVSNEINRKILGSIHTDIIDPIEAELKHYEMYEILAISKKTKEKIDKRVKLLLSNE